METLETPSVLIFSSCANFLDFHTIFCTILRIFAQFCCVFEHFCKILHIFAKFCIFLLIFARLCIFLHAFFVLIFQAQKLCLCYFSRNFQLWFCLVAKSGTIVDSFQVNFQVEKPPRLQCYAIQCVTTPARCTTELETSVK